MLLDRRFSAANPVKNSFSPQNSYGAQPDRQLWLVQKNGDLRKCAFPYHRLIARRETDSGFERLLIASLLTTRTAATKGDQRGHDQVPLGRLHQVPLLDQTGQHE